jgi:SAM-dependent methyltransferase
MTDHLMELFYPESRFGGFTDIDGTLAFYLRVNALATSKDVVLDFGCGQGTSADDPVPIRLGLRVLKGKVSKVIGVDVDPRGAENPFLDEFCPLHPGERWPVDTGSIDLVLCDNVLEHLPDPGAFFREARRVLRPGGRLCVRTPNVLSYFGLASRLVPNMRHEAVLKVVQRGREECFPTLYRANTVWALRRMMRRHGFDHAIYGYEAEPSYLHFSRLAYAIGVLHQRFAPRTIRLAIFAFGLVANRARPSTQIPGTAVS